ncbi:MAG: antitoxin component YwqK of YwqJK toxin-antitoxin module [Algoriphagus sp.]|jgi:antitoxin component YwqK of YwqJK toxin-antitoxin module
MEVAFMELRALFLSSWVFLIVSCGRSEIADLGQAFPENDDRISTSNGIVFREEVLFSGRLFGLYEGGTDTAFVSGYQKGLLHGEQIQFWENGELKEKRFYKSGEKYGIYDSWWPNGQKQFTYFFKNGEYEGELKEWNRQGMLSRIMNYEKGHETGVQKWWYESGEIKANYVIKNGRRYGLLGTKNCTNVSDSVFVTN